MAQFKLVVSEDADEQLKFLPDMVALGNSEREAVGFLPRGALSDAIRRRKVIAMFDVSQSPKRLVGYLLHSGVFPNAKVQQIVVQEEFRKNRVGETLLNQLLSNLDRAGFISIRADVASDLVRAKSFYSHNKFVPVRVVPGGQSRNRKIIIYERELEGNSLFSVNSNNGPSADFGLVGRGASEHVIYALDLNVYFDLARDRRSSGSARKIFGAVLNHSLRIAVADEFVGELEGTARNPGSDPIYQMALQIPRLPPPNKKQHDEVSDEIHGMIFSNARVRGAGRPQSMSDCRHIAHAILARASAFVTRDKVLLGARDKLLAAFSIDVIHPDELVNMEFVSMGEALPLRRSGIGFSLESSSRDQFEGYLRKADVSLNLYGEFCAVPPSEEGVEYLAIREEARVVAVGALFMPKTGDARARILVHASPVVGAGLYVDFLLDYCLRRVSSFGAVSVFLRSLPGQPLVSSVAKSKGFVRFSMSHEMTKVALGRPVTETTWSNAVAMIRSRTGVVLPDSVPTDGIVSVKNFGESMDSVRSVTLRSLEDMLAPTIILTPRRDGVIVPIQKAYAELLLGAGKQFLLDVLPEKDASFYSRRAYIKTPGKGCAFSPDMPILFYESKSGRGDGVVIAVARVVDIVSYPKDNLPPTLVSRSVIDDLTKISSSERVEVVQFDNIFRLPNPVSLATLRKLGALPPTNLVTASAIDGVRIMKIVEMGWG